MVIDKEVVGVSEYCEDDKESVLESVAFSASVKDVRRAAFKNCKRLATVNFAEGLEKIGEAAFFGCESIRELRFPESLNEIGSQAFRRCTSLVDVTISDALLLSIPDDVFTSCPCEEALHARKVALVVEREENLERRRVLNYQEFFNRLYDQVMTGRNLDYTDKYRGACEGFARTVNITAQDVAVLKRLYQEEANRVASVGRGCMDVQFSNYNEHHDGFLSWEGLDKERLASIAMSIRNIGAINDDALQNLEDLWRQFFTTVGRLNLRQVFTRMIASLRPDLTVPVVHPEAMDELYGWFRRNGFISEDARIAPGPHAWLRNWLVQNNQIKQFLTTCLGKGPYEIGPFVWYFVEAFREGEQTRNIVVSRQDLIRTTIMEAGYAVPDSWEEADE